LGQNRQRATPHSGEFGHQAGEIGSQQRSRVWIEVLACRNISHAA
jgi:hypothetical protein